MQHKAASLEKLRLEKNRMLKKYSDWATEWIRYENPTYIPIYEEIDCIIESDSDSNKDIKKSFEV